MHILLTGGTGLIGSALVQHGLTHGHSFTILTRQTLIPREHVNFIQSLDDLSGNMRFDGVVNLAGEPIADARWSKKRKQVLLDSRVSTTQRLVNFISSLEYRPPVLVSASATGWYGNQTGEVTEESAPTQEFTHELCQAWEQSAFAAETLGVRVCLLRIGLVLARNGGFLERLLLPFRLGLGGHLGTGRQYMPWVHLDDIVEMIFFLIENTECQGTYNGTAPEPVSNREFTRILGKCLNRPTFLPVPEFVLKIALGEMSRLLLTGQKAVPTKLLQAGYAFQNPSLQESLGKIVRKN